MRNWRMSSYLDRLGARHTDAPAIRPRAVSRFESPFVAPFVTATAHDDTVLDDTARHTTSGVSVNDTPRLDPLARGMPSRDVGTRHADAWRTGAATASPGVETTDSDALEPLEAVRPRTEFADRALAPLSPLGTSPITVTAALRPSTAPPVRGTLNATPMAPTPNRDAPVAGVVVAPRSRAQVPSATSDVLAQTGAPASREPDVVRVHIGRVEVRAIMPTARPTPRQSASTNESRPMTLDRYLGGKDRT